MVTENLCLVCGFLMEVPPCDYNICPSCRTEFGVGDVDSSIAELRVAWLGTGPQWWSPVDQQPPNWDPILQMVTGIVLTSILQQHPGGAVSSAVRPMKRSLARRLRKRRYSVPSNAPSVREMLQGVA